MQGYQRTATASNSRSALPVRNWRASPVPSGVARHGLPLFMPIRPNKHREPRSRQVVQVGGSEVNHGNRITNGGTRL